MSAPQSSYLRVGTSPEATMAATEANEHLGQLEGTPAPVSRQDHSEAPTSEVLRRFPRPGVDAGAHHRGSVARYRRPLPWRAIMATMLLLGALGLLVIWSMSPS